MNNEFEINRTKSGLPAIWEEGGAYSNTGSATCVANGDGTPKTALFVRHGGHLACGRHALFVVRPGDLVCCVSQWRGDEHIRLFRLGEEADEAHMNATLISEFSDGEWTVEEQLHDEAVELFIDETCRKAHDYHCRSMYYGNEKERR